MSPWAGRSASPASRKERRMTYAKEMKAALARMAAEGGPEIID